MNSQIISIELSGVKPCRKCGARDRNKRGNCRPCQNMHQRNWRQFNLEKSKNYSRKYYEANRDKVLERKRKYCKENPDIRANINRNWKNSNPEKVKALKENYRARKRGNGGKLSSNIVQTLFAKQGGKCVCCGESLENGYHLDHIMPLALGGLNEDSNVQLLTPKCNLSKSDKHPKVWAREKGIVLDC